MELSSIPSNTSDSNDYPRTIPSPLENTQDSTKRRSSSRSIKRRRFDDELVEYSLGLPGASLGKGEKRIRTQSYTNNLPDMGGIPTNPTPVANFGERRRSSGKLPLSGRIGRKSRRKAHLSQLSTKDLGRWKPTDDLALILGAQQTNDLRIVHRGIKFSCRFTVGELQSRWYALLYNTEVSRVAVAAMRNLHPDLVAAIQQQSLYSTAEEDLLGTIASVRKGRPRKSYADHIGGIIKNGQILSTRGACMKRLMDVSEAREICKDHTMWKSSLCLPFWEIGNPHPTIEKFQDLLEQNPHIFYSSRTPKSLMKHWQLLKQYQLLPDQAVQPLQKGENVTLSDAEESTNDTELQDLGDENVEIEMQLADRVEKKNIRLLENSLPRWQVLVQSVAGGNVELDKNTLAVLRGRLVRYLMRSRETDGHLGDPVGVHFFFLKYGTINMGKSSSSASARTIGQRPRIKGKRIIYS
ncbi:Microspherule protein 1 [Eumeta japonica]|uniref:Microspherule protein 1 n=1 Tax=Eumeta variegata TaxID=151549 RepID=A0A4C1YU67_EUMVA|nr:Microspherule protein 1 [Eumeta japonica]